MKVGLGTQPYLLLVFVRPPQQARAAAATTLGSSQANSKRASKAGGSLEVSSRTVGVSSGLGASSQEEGSQTAKPKLHVAATSIATMPKLPKPFATEEPIPTKDEAVLRASAPLATFRLQQPG